MAAPSIRYAELKALIDTATVGTTAQGFTVDAIVPFWEQGYRELSVSKGNNTWILRQLGSPTLFGKVLVYDENGKVWTPKADGDWNP